MTRGPATAADKASKPVGCLARPGPAGVETLMTQPSGKRDPTTMRQRLHHRSDLRRATGGVRAQRRRTPSTARRGSCHRPARTTEVVLVRRRPPSPRRITVPARPSASSVCGCALPCNQRVPESVTLVLPRRRTWDRSNLSAGRDATTADPSSCCACHLMRDSSST